MEVAADLANLMSEVGTAEFRELCDSGKAARRLGHDWKAAGYVARMNNVKYDTSSCCVLSSFSATFVHLFQPFFW